MRATKLVNLKSHLPGLFRDEGKCTENMVFLDVLMARQANSIHSVRPSWLEWHNKKTRGIFVDHSEFFGNVTSVDNKTISITTNNL